MLPLALTAVAFSVTGCWKLPEEYPELPEARVEFEPEAFVAPPDWFVTPHDVQLHCPNGEDTRFYLLASDAMRGSTNPVPGAVLFHSGAFDFVFVPQPDDALEGTHFAVPSRLSHGWAIRHVFATLGLLPNELEGEVHLGSLPVALAEAGIAVLLPTNCWGDMWHNRIGVADNDFPADLFARDGRSSAEWAFQFMTDPLFASSFRVDLGIEIDPEQVYLIGLGDGGRAVAEIMAVDFDDDGLPDHRPAGALVDSVPDDLSVYFGDLTTYSREITGLQRVFPAGPAEAMATSLGTVPLPERFGYVYSRDDPNLPVAVHGAIVDRLAGDPDRWLYTDTISEHVLLNGQDIGLARQAVGYLTTGVKPAPGPGR